MKTISLIKGCGGPWLSLARMLLLMTPAATGFVQAQEIWQQPEGIRCIDLWTQDVARRLNSYNGRQEFNSRKPWSVNQYGLFVAQGIASAYEPDDWGTYGGNKYAWMWNHYTTELARPDWRNPDFNGAGLPGLRYFVRQCIGSSGGLSNPPPPGTAPPSTGLDTNATCPRNFNMHQNSTLILICYCSPQAIAGSVWGTDVYTSDSSLCAAARHAGVIGPSGGMIQVKGEPGRSAYAGTARNGLTSSNYGKYPWSFYFPAAGRAGRDAGTAQYPQCPGDFKGYRNTGGSLTCHCAPGAMRGNVWGTDVYTDDSSICAAARHAGAVPAAGGPVTVQAAPGRASYQGSLRNSIQSKDYGSWQWSFRFPRD